MEKGKVSIEKQMKTKISKTLVSLVSTPKYWKKYKPHVSASLAHSSAKISQRYPNKQKPTTLQSSTQISQETVSTI